MVSNFIDVVVGLLGQVKTHKEMDGWIDGWMDGWIDGRMDGWMDVR